MAETEKAYARRLREGWFERFVPDSWSGIDIGCQRDPLNQTFRRYDLIFGDSDATFMHGVSDCLFSTVYASHVLEHLNQPVVAIQNWFRICKPGGHVIIVVPHRDLYEKRQCLPSRWNGDHKTFYLPETTEPPDTLSFRGIIERALPDVNLVSFRILDESWISESPDVHSAGEYSIEAIIKK